MAAKKEESKKNNIASFFKNYPKSSIAFAVLLIYQLIRVFLEPIQSRLIGLAVYLVIIYLLIIGSAKPALEYHFSTFEKTKKDQIALAIFIVLYLINLFVGMPYSIILLIIMIIIFFKFLFKYLFIFIDIFAARTSEKRLK